MKKFIPFLVSGMLVAGTFGCGEGANDSASETPTETGTNTEAVVPSAKEASSNTSDKSKPGEVPNVDSLKDTADVEELAGKASGAVAKSAKKALKKEFPTSDLEVTENEGVITISGTVSSEEELKKVQSVVEKIPGVKGVNLETKVEPAAAE